MTNIPDFCNSSTDTDVAALKARCEDARALGIVQSGESELMVIFDGELGSLTLFSRLVRLWDVRFGIGVHFRLMLGRFSADYLLI